MAATVGGVTARLLADLLVMGHLFFIVFLVVGGPLARRFPRLLKWHLAAAGVTVLVSLTNSPCPLTVWEKHFLALAGEQPYETGFIEHYLVEPVHPAGIDAQVNLVLLAAWIVPTAYAYLSLWAHRPRVRLDS